MLMPGTRRQSHLIHLRLRHRKHVVTPILHHHPDRLNHVNQPGVSAVKINTNINRTANTRTDRKTCAASPDRPMKAPTKTKYRQDT